MTPFKSFAFLLLCVLSLSFAGCDSSKELPAELQREIGTVVLEIDFGDEKRTKSIDVVCSPDSTVMLSLERAQQMKKLNFKATGSGETFFLDSIDGVANDTKEGKYWTYRVNDALGNKSAGIFAVKPADKITWSFGDRPKELE